MKYYMWNLDDSKTCFVLTATNNEDYFLINNKIDKIEINQKIYNFLLNNCLHKKEPGNTYRGIKRDRWYIYILKHQNTAT